jgi:hypothetical protein
MIVLCFSGRSVAVAQLNAEQHFERVMKNPNIQVEGQVTGEGFCWHAAHAANDFVTGYLAFEDTAWLDQAVKYFDWLVGVMAEGPDGYKGWIGPFIYDKSVWCDVHVGDAIVCNPMLRFAEVVLKDEGLSAQYGEAANRYVALAKKHLIEKWDTRGTWHKDGPYGSYASWDRYLKPGDLSEWREIEIQKSSLSLPFNKQFDMGIASLRLWRITGEVKYREKAERIFRLMKSRIRLVDDHYVWNYWEPLGSWDVGGDDLRHWVNVHPYRNYQAGEVGDIVEAYHSGIVFDRVDIERIVRTNLKVMWSGDLENPKWRNSNAHGEWAPPTPPPEGWKGRAGTLWSALRDFDGTVRGLYEKTLEPGKLSHAFYHNVTAKQAIGFDRKYKMEAEVFEVPFSDCADLTMVAMLPSAIGHAQASVLICKSETGGTLEVGLYGEDGERIVVLYDNTMMGGTDGVKGVFTMPWDGTNAMGKPVRPGRYYMRWTLNGAYRQIPVWIE